MHGHSESEHSFFFIFIEQMQVTSVLCANNVFENPRENDIVHEDSEFQVNTTLVLYIHNIRGE